MRNQNGAQELREEVNRLREEVDRYRAVASDVLQQLDWCIGYFVGAHKRNLAKGLAANRSRIRRQLRW
jgi:hypothetical protein